MKGIAYRWAGCKWLPRWMGTVPSKLPHRQQEYHPTPLSGHTQSKIHSDTPDVKIMPPLANKKYNKQHEYIWIYLIISDESGMRQIWLACTIATSSFGVFRSLRFANDSIPKQWSLTPYSKPPVHLNPSCAPLLAQDCHNGWVTVNYSEPA